MKMFEFKAGWGLSQIGHMSLSKIYIYASSDKIKNGLKIYDGRVCFSESPYKMIVKGQSYVAHGTIHFLNMICQLLLDG